MIFAGKDTLRGTRKPSRVGESNNSFAFMHAGSSNSPTPPPPGIGHMPFEMPENGVLTVEWITDAQQKFTQVVARRAVLRLYDQLESRSGRQVLQQESQHQKSERLNREARWKKLDKNTRRIQKLKYRFHLFAINGENSLDITEFELMMRDLCVSFANGTELVNTFKAISSSPGARLISFEDFEKWITEKSTVHNRSMGLKAQKAMARMTGRSDRIAARRAMMQMCIKRSRSKAENVFRDYIKNLIEQDHVTVDDTDRDRILAWVHKSDTVAATATAVAPRVPQVAGAMSSAAMMSKTVPRIPKKPPQQQQTSRDLASTESNASFDRRTKTLTVPPGTMGIVLTESRRGGVKIAQFAETSSLKDSGLAVGMRILSISKGGSKITVDLSEATLEEVQQLISDWQGYTKIFTLDTRTVRRRMGGGNNNVGWRKAHADRLDDVSELPQSSLSLDTPAKLDTPPPITKRRESKKGASKRPVLEDGMDIRDYLVTLREWKKSQDINERTSEASDLLAKVVADNADTEEEFLAALGSEGDDSPSHASTNVTPGARSVHPFDRVPGTPDSERDEIIAFPSLSPSSDRSETLRPQLDPIDVEILKVETHDLPMDVMNNEEQVPIEQTVGSTAAQKDPEPEASNPEPKASTDKHSADENDDDDDDTTDVEASPQQPSPDKEMDDFVRRGQVLFPDWPVPSLRGYKQCGWTLDALVKWRSANDPQWSPPQEKEDPAESTVEESHVQMTSMDMSEMQLERTSMDLEELAVDDLMPMEVEGEPHTSTMELIMEATQESLPEDDGSAELRKPRSPMKEKVFVRSGHMTMDRKLAESVRIAQLEMLIIQWLCDQLGEKFSQHMVLHEYIGSGVRLCKFMSKLPGGSIKIMHANAALGSFQARDNFSCYIKVCKKLDFPANCIVGLSALEGDSQKKDVIKALCSKITFLHKKGLVTASATLLSELDESKTVWNVTDRV